MKTLYHYHPETGELLGESPADPSPLEPEVWLIPAHATDLPPPKTKARQVAVFRDVRWQLAPDWRSAALWSTEDGTAVSIADIGVTPADVHATETPRPSAAHRWQNGQWQEDADLRLALLDALKIELCQQIDGLADQVRRELAGDPLRVAEYDRAAQEASAYQTAGYAGTVPPAVLSWAEAKGWIAQAAADDILRAADRWNAARYQLRDQRLKTKEAIRSALDEASANAIAAAGLDALRTVPLMADALPP
ncbi:TPA: hypothetical protein RCG82_000613 [Enterobacter roggenkampii]|uniref:Tail fiber assembly protein n=1 Tax=Enterobacter roggenkampii TaxID=1812935 RepID=A0AAU9B7G3_9ENTR|nr:hypothetical protein [Enterobacter roggenkampii]BCL41004.1 hypothetical protein OIPHN260_05060 [Enterobacter roggenkampii]HDT2084602.1 hypothetical protein [Enterobacter roggenkampii]